MWEKIKIYFAMGEYCVKEATSYAPCREFWVMGAYAALAAVVLLAMLVIVARTWRVHAMRRASKRLTLEYLESQQRVADEPTMRSLMWKGDSIVAPERDQSRITAEIRDALRTRKING